MIDGDFDEKNFFYEKLYDIYSTEAINDRIKESNESSSQIENISIINVNEENCNDKRDNSFSRINEKSVSPMDGLENNQIANKNKQEKIPTQDDQNDSYNLQNIEMREKNNAAFAKLSSTTQKILKELFDFKS